MIIAIDGPAGAGKSTVAKKVARQLGYLYIDTGAMYRALTLASIEKGVDIHDEQALIELTRSIRIDLRPGSDGSLEVYLDGCDVSADIRTPAVSGVVSEVSRIKEIRSIMVQMQRALGEKNNSVIDGRDIGTVVFPHAEKKYYLDADFEERVRRRHQELVAAGLAITREAVAQDLRNRDRIDSTRECSPLKKAPDAAYVDTTKLSIDEVVTKLLKDIATWTKH
jgi:CMP/dCMP kinase